MPETNCVVPECRNNGHHILPANKQRRDIWIQAIKRGKNKYEKWTPPSKFCYVCRSHFTDEDYVSVTYHGSAPERRSLKRSAVPSVFPWKVPKSEEGGRRLRCEARSSKRRKLFDERTSSCENKENITCGDDLIVGCIEEVSTSTCELGTDIVFNDCTPVVETTFHSAPTQTEVQRMFSVENFRKDNAGIHFYTGLENILKFYFVLETLGPAAYHLNYVYHNIVSIDVADQFFIVLMKLRRHKTNFELSRMFGVSEKVILNIFITWINFMYLQWKELSIWLPKELVAYFMPTGFKRSFPSTRVIVDGTECPVKKPRNPKTQQQTFSTYKNRNTVKVLVGATPGGLISFVSAAYGGSTSDRQITERSSLMHLCDPKDSIMADKGFNVQDIFAPKDVSINIPTFFKKKNRMSGETVIKDRKISSKRVHIERIIGLAKTYKILTEPMSATETKLSTEIIFVCFMLCNFRSGIIPKYA